MWGGMVNRCFWHRVALVVLLYYPVMVVKWLPFGGGPRYLSVLIPLVCLPLIYKTPHDEALLLLRAAWRWAWPLLPFAAAWSFAQLWHEYHPSDYNPLTRVFFGGLLYMGARRLGVSYRQLFITAAVAASIYCVVGLYEVFFLGRERAWGGTYENRFGQYAAWMVALLGVHYFSDDLLKQRAKAWGAYSAITLLGLAAIVLSGSRGALIALFVLILIAVFRSMSWRRGILVAGSVAVVLIAAAMLFQPLAVRVLLIYDQVAAYFSGAGYNPDSIGLRLELIRIAGLMLQQHPVFGPGTTALSAIYETHPALGVPYPEMLALPGFHSDMGQMIALGGGVCLAGWLTSCVWMLSVARNDPFRQSFIVLSLVFGISEIFFANNLGISLLTASWALYAAAADNRKKTDESDQAISVQAG